MVSDAISPVVRLERVFKSYGRHPVLRDVSFEVALGEVMAILGPSGCGKTTTLRVIAGFERPDSGGVFIAGTRVAGEGVYLPPEERALGMVFQDYALFPHIPVAGNIAFGLKRMPGEQVRKVVATMLELVDMKDLSHRYPHELSGGQQQRVALARALAPCPNALLMDEPFSNLDADLRPRMRAEVLKILRQAQTTAILVTHDQEEALTLADRVAVLNEGRLEQVSTPDDIYHRPRTPFVARFVGHADFVAGRMQRDLVVTELGTFPAENHFTGGAVKLMVRPDDIDLEPEDGGSAVVVAREFRGPQNMYQLRLDSGAIVHSSQPSLTIYAVGQRVKATAHPDHVVVFPEDAAIASEAPGEKHA